MEFGKLPNVDHVNWQIPEPDPTTVKYFAERRSLQCSPKEMTFYFGAPAWAHPEWVGKIYPAGTPRTAFLRHYSRYFSCIELNTTHYRIPTADQARRWVAEVPKNFRFCPKIFKEISHRPRGMIDKAVLAEWWKFLESLGENAGPGFLQLPPHFDYSSKALLFAFLKQWPADFPLAIELRHSSWFTGGKVGRALTEYLMSKGIGLVITDVAGRRDVLHTSISSEFSLVRFIGNDLHRSDLVRAKAWSHVFRQWKDMGLKQLFLFIHEPDDLAVPEMTAFFLEQLRNVGIVECETAP
jgi:uncharacterized protein YecE (DUF72 family)